MKAKLAERLSVDMGIDQFSMRKALRSFADSNRIASEVDRTYIEAALTSYRPVRNELAMQAFGYAISRLKLDSASFDGVPRDFKQSPWFAALKEAGCRIIGVHMYSTRHESVIESRRRRIEAKGLKVDPRPADATDEAIEERQGEYDANHDAMMVSLHELCGNGLLELNVSNGRLPFEERYGAIVKHLNGPHGLIRATADEEAGELVAA